MYVIVVGGGKVGYYLAKTLLAEGHEVAIVERDEKKVAKLDLDMGGVLVREDGSTPGGLERAGAGRAQVLVAVTGQDETNLVACQVAKTYFNVPRTIARINNPKNEDLFRILDAGTAVSSTQIITDLILREVDTNPLQKVLALDGTDARVVEILLPPGAPAVERSLAAIHLPEGSLVVAVIRDGHLTVPDGQTQLRQGDRLFVITDPKHALAVTAQLIGQPD